jgi:hypothetical protein
MTLWTADRSHFCSYHIPTLRTHSERHRESYEIWLMLQYEYVV